MPYVYDPSRSQPVWRDDPVPTPNPTPTTSITKRTPTPGQDTGGNPLLNAPLGTTAIGSPVTSAGVSSEKWLSDNATWLMVVLTGLTIIVMLLVVVL